MYLNAFPIIVIQQNQYILTDLPTKQQTYLWITYFGDNNWND